MYQNPFTYIPADACADAAFDAFPVEQDCTSYDQKRAEVAGLIILPTDGVGVSGDWFDFAQWEAIFDNTGVDATAPRYIVGRGSWQPTDKDTANLAGGRLVLNGERTYRCAFSCSNMDSGHVSFAKRLQRNKVNFTYWLHTVDGRVIGGESGMAPVYVDADIPFLQGDAREVINLILDNVSLETASWE